MNEKILKFKFNINNKALALAMCFVIMFTFMFISTSYSHTISCHNYNCNMCEIVENAHIVDNFLLLPFFCYGIFVIASLVIENNNQIIKFIPNTLVSQKVRLDN